MPSLIFKISIQIAKNLKILNKKVLRTKIVKFKNYIFIF